ncbi:MAG: hypothetical protein K0S44_247 [Bacteroidetes bacterium]|jgi:hypothetical protein|nr:hypothetical protein [Bacteroidota bacterium]
MTQKDYLKLSLNIIVTFTMWIMISFVPDYLHDLFGDWICDGSRFIANDGAYGHYEGCDYANDGNHLPKLHWGFRHWLWCIMGISLVIVQGFRIANLFKNKNA